MLPQITVTESLVTLQLVIFGLLFIIEIPIFKIAFLHGEYFIIDIIDIIVANHE